jgi:hypothetical protein
MKKLSIIGIAMALLVGVLGGCSSNTPPPPVSQVADIAPNLSENVPAEGLLIPSRPILTAELATLGYVQSATMESIDEGGRPYTLSIWNTRTNDYSIAVEQSGTIPLVTSISDVITTGTNAMTFLCGVSTGDGVSLAEKLKSFAAKKDAFLSDKDNRKLDRVPARDGYKVIEPNEALGCFMNAS